MRFLRSIEGNTKRERMRRNEIRENLQINPSEGKLTNNRICF
jgi:hypothetical protein